jgi:hypothetical protein
MEPRLVYLYVDGVQVGTLFTAWTIRRVMTRLRLYNPKAQSLEVTVEMKPSGNNALSTMAQDRRSASPATDSTLPVIGDRRAIGERQAKKDDPGR